MRADREGFRGKRFDRAGTAADERDDLEFVAVAKFGLRVLDTPDEVAIEFDRDMLGTKVQLFKQAGDIERCGEVASFAIDGDGHGLGSLVSIDNHRKEQQKHLNERGRTGVGTYKLPFPKSSRVESLQSQGGVAA